MRTRADTRRLTPGVRRRLASCWRRTAGVLAEAAVAALVLNLNQGLPVD